MGGAIFYMMVCVLAYFCPPLALAILFLIDKYK